MLEFNMEFHPISSIIDLVMGINETKAIEKNIQFVSEYGPNLPSLIEVDKSRLTQIVLNLVSNAIKFTERDGEVRIRVTWNYNVAKKLNRPILKPKKEYKKSTFMIEEHKKTTVFM